jgi:hypothetical protein
VSFVRGRFSTRDCSKTLEYNWGGTKLHYRPGTSDQDLIYDILLRTGRKEEYWLPDDIQSEVILDIGRISALPRRIWPAGTRGHGSIRSSRFPPISPF